MNQQEVISMLASDDNFGNLNVMSQIHLFTKHYLLIAEELSEDGVAFLQPMKEHRDAYDHLMRVFSVHINDSVTDDKASEYISDNIRKALGHEYRSFFDAADWLTYICRKGIREQLMLRSVKKKYSQKYDDYDDVKSLINNLPFTIAEFREDKDVSKVGVMLDNVIEYRDTMDRLIEIYRRIQSL